MIFESMGLSEQNVEAPRTTLKKPLTVPIAKRRRPNYTKHRQQLITETLVHPFFELIHQNLGVQQSSSAIFS